MIAHSALGRRAGFYRKREISSPRVPPPTVSGLAALAADVELFRRVSRGGILGQKVSLSGEGVSAHDGSIQVQTT